MCNAVQVCTCQSQTFRGGGHFLGTHCIHLDSMHAWSFLLHSGIEDWQRSEIRGIPKITRLPLVDWTWQIDGQLYCESAAHWREGLFVGWKRNAWRVGEQRTCRFDRTPTGKRHSLYWLYQSIDTPSVACMCRRLHTSLFIALQWLIGETYTS